MGSTPRGISASRGAAVLGLSEFQTPLSVWQSIMEEREPGWNEKHGYTPPEPPDSAAIRFGTAFESAVVELAERAAGKRIKHREEFLSIAFNGAVIKDGPLTCHIDGVYMNGDMPSTLHEGKTTNAFTFREKWGQPGTDKIPQVYQVQVRTRCCVPGRRKRLPACWFFQKCRTSGKKTA
jgi:predicted phage-related endonuclease